MLDKHTKKLVIKETERMQKQLNNQIDHHVNRVEEWAKEWRDTGSGLEEMCQHAAIVQQLNSKLEVLDKFLSENVEGDTK